MKKQFVLIGLVLLLLSAWFSGCQSQGFRVHKIHDEPINYVDITEEQMNNFPHLKEAILTNTSVETPPEEMYQLRGILEYFDTEMIKYQDEYYEVGFWHAD